MTQSEQLAQAALQAPINNLVILLALIALVIVLLVGFAIWKVAPAVINLFKQQADTNSKLTQLVGQHSNQLTLAIDSVDKNTTEMVKQTSAIDAQTVEIKGQSLDLRNYQTLVSDNLSAHTEQIAVNTANIVELKASIDALPEQIRLVIEDKLACAGIEALINKLRDEIFNITNKQEAQHSASQSDSRNG